MTLNYGGFFNVFDGWKLPYTELSQKNKLFTIILLTINNFVYFKEVIGVFK